MKGRGVYFSAIPPPGGGGFLQVESLGWEVFQVDTKDMKKKHMSEWEIFSSQGEGGGIFTSLLKNIRPWNEPKVSIMIAQY